MALIVPPAVVTRALQDDPGVHRKLLLMYDNFPLSTREFLHWYNRYAAQRQFASDHPDIILVDVAKAFEAIGKNDRLGLFFDHKHLTPQGNRLLLEVIFGTLRKSLALDGPTRAERRP